MSNIFLLGSLSDTITKTLYDLGRRAGHTIRIYENMGDRDRLPEDPPDLVPDYVIVCHHDWMEYLYLEEFLEVLADGSTPEYRILLSSIGTPGYEVPFVSEFLVTRLVMFSPLAFYQDRHVVEIAPTLITDEDVLEECHSLFDTMGINAYLVTDTPSMIFPRILAMLVNEAASALMEDVASPEDIDTAMKLGTNYPEGPLAWADKVGLDIIFRILDNLYAEYGEERYRPVLLIKQMVGNGKLGIKTGEGFYSYHPQPTEPANIE